MPDSEDTFNPCVDPGFIGPLFVEADGTKTWIDPAWDTDTPPVSDEEWAADCERLKPAMRRNRRARRQQAVDSTPELHTACFALAAKRLGRIATRHFDGMMHTLDRTLLRLKVPDLRSTQLMVLVLVWTNTERKWNISELANELSVARCTLSRCLKRLAKRRLIRFAPGSDRRSRVAQLTRQGRAVAVAAQAGWLRAAIKLSAGCPDWQDPARMRTRLDHYAARTLRALGRPVPTTHRAAPS